MVTALVFPGASASLVRAHLPPHARVVAVDAGAEALHAAGVRPDVVVGDMDSVSATTLAALERAGATIVRHPAEKRDTDGALAVRLAEGDDLVFLGPGGGRADHALANVHLLLAASRGARVRAVDEDAFMWVATPEHPVELALPLGTVVSVLPLTDRCEGVTYAGLRYALTGATMEAGDPYGVSNECRDPPQRVAVARGALLVVAPRMD